MNEDLNKNAESSKFFRRKKRKDFIERTIVSLIRKTERVLFAEEVARENGFLQSIDPRVKIVGLLGLILAVTFSRNLLTIFLLFAVAVLLAVFSRVPLGALAARAWLSVLAFTGVIAVPVLFVTPGAAIYKVPLLNWTITAQGLTSAMYLLSRVETTVTFSLLLVLCTPWTQVLKALRVLRVPVVFVVILGMTYRYIFVMLETAQNMFEARQSRLIGKLSGGERRQIAAASIGVLLSKSFYLNSEIYLAMQSRGFRGEVYTLDEFAMRGKDWLALAGFSVVFLAALWLGRLDAPISSLSFGFFI